MSLETGVVALRPGGAVDTLERAVIEVELIALFPPGLALPSEP